MGEAACLWCKVYFKFNRMPMVSADNMKKKSRYLVGLKEAGQR